VLAQVSRKFRARQIAVLLRAELRLRLSVAVTDTTAAITVRPENAAPKIVSRDAGQLSASPAAPRT
jgi:hypothetical protein